MFHVNNFDPRVLTWWRSRRAKIDMNPSYQRRGGLWSTKDKAFLIDSILNDYDIPKIYIADFTGGASPLNRRNLPYAIIDGKQRFEAIFEFFDDLLVLNDDFAYREDPSLNLSGLSYSDLRTNHYDIAEKVENFHLSVMRVVTDEEDQINELFIRLNRNKPLTGAEIRNAMIGPVPELIRKLADHYFFTHTVRFRVTRGGDLNAAAKLLLFEHTGKPTDTKKGQLDELAEQGEKGELAEFEQAARRVTDVLDQMVEVFIERDPLLKSAGIVPVYYWLVRHTARRNQLHLREFLVDFERLRMEHGDTRELSRYNSLNRSTDNRVSHEYRFEILQERFKSFLKKVRA